MTKGQVAKLRDEANNRAKKARDADDDYRKLLTVTNTKQELHFSQELPAAINVTTGYAEV